MHNGQDRQALLAVMLAVAVRASTFLAVDRTP